MNEWAQKAIGKSLKLTCGFPFPSNRFSTEEGFPLIRIRDILDSKIQTFYQGDFSPTYVVRKGDILVGMDGDFHVVRWRNGDGLLNQRVLKVEVLDAGALDLDFAFYWLAPYIQKVNEVTAATTVKHLSVKDVVKAAGRIPDVVAQQKIAAILTSLDTAIEKTEALIEKHQQIKTGLMHDLFTRGVLPNGQLRPPREQAPELYQETPLGWVPRDWDVSGLAGKARTGVNWIRTGPFGSSLKGEHWVSHGHPVITIGALGEGEFLEPELLFVGKKDAARLIDFQLKAGDVVFSRVADVGRSVVIREPQAGWIMSSNLMRIALDEGKVRADYLQMLLAADSRIKRQIKAHVNSGGRDVANSEVLNQLRFPWPHIQEQDRIIARAQAIAQRIRSLNAGVAKANRQKLGLMQDLLTGKVPVKTTAPEAVPA
jgi:type I restriction enzyme S subunit